ncbi:hypothetical protein FHX42_005266 [Saccharopolyspora lacisalsi]|uniref:Uncharacterized protein n=1 Tax=Halosaccharopolyspora lacisalsi TaxID=1000566 RepID=A0A839E4T3_9PSEU|nr:hypothetical protein [Halosaccharopolyspora lacisalsi]MBA8827859.1 hypothetical protein [Halosaccharopolyspora lacisalsi]
MAYLGIGDRVRVWDSNNVHWDEYGTVFGPVHNHGDVTLVQVDMWDGSRLPLDADALAVVNHRTTYADGASAETAPEPRYNVGDQVYGRTGVVPYVIRARHYIPERGWIYTRSTVGSVIEHDPVLENELHDSDPNASHEAPAAPGNCVTADTYPTGPDHYRKAHLHHANAEAIDQELSTYRNHDTAEYRDWLRAERDHEQRRAEWHTAQAHVAATVLSSLPDIPDRVRDDWKRAINGQ